MPTATGSGACVGVHRRARVVLPDGQITWTLVDPEGMPVAPVEAFCAYLRASAASPNTIRAYMGALAPWWLLLTHTGHAWMTFPTSLFGDFLVFLRTGDLPALARIGPPGQWLAESSVAQHAAAVLSFYRFHAVTGEQLEPYQRLYSRHVARPGARYRPMLQGVAARVDSPPPRPVYPVRTTRPARPPLLTPAQVGLILDGCVTVDDAGSWSGSLARLRDRLLFATLAHSGMRLGEALTLRHHDWHVGAGDTPWIDIVARQDHPHGARVKSGRDRRVYVDDTLESLYSAYVWELVEAGIDLDVPDLAHHQVFVNTSSRPRWAPLRPESVYTRTRALTRTIPALPARWSPHWLRHTHATALLLAGCPPHVVMRRLGHADVQTTLDRYGWVTDDAHMRAVGDWKAYTAGWKGVFDA